MQCVHRGGLHFPVDCDRGYHYLHEYQYFGGSLRTLWDVVYFVNSAVFAVQRVHNSSVCEQSNVFGIALDLFGVHSAIDLCENHWGVPFALH